MEPSVGVEFVLVLGAVALGFDDDDAFQRNAFVWQREQAVFNPLGQAGGNNIKAQMNCAADLVDVLPPSPLRPNGGDFNF